MDAQRISWFVKNEDNVYSSKKEYYAGVYTKEEELTVFLQLWNNKAGTKDVTPLEKFAINIYFEDIEDSVLLRFCKITMNNVEELSLVPGSQKATILFPDNIIISGVSNDGSDTAVDNYINLKFSFSAPNYTLKENDLKSMYFEIISLN